MRILLICCLFLLSGCFLKNSISTRAERKELRQIKRCNRKFERLALKCPMLLKTDTVTVEVPLQVDSVAIAKVFEGNKDVTGVDSIIDRYRRSIDSVNAIGGDMIGIVDNLSKDVKDYVINRKCIPDSIIIDTSVSFNLNGKQYFMKIQFGAFPEKGDIGIFCRVPDQSFISDVDCPDQKLSFKELTVKQQLIEMYRSFTTFFWIAFIIATILLLLYFRKKFL